MVPARLRRLYGKAVRRCEVDQTTNNVARVMRLWEKCKAAADRNLGI